jgi:hypothetical protein
LQGPLCNLDRPGACFFCSALQYFQVSLGASDVETSSLDIGATRRAEQTCELLACRPHGEPARRQFRSGRPEALQRIARPLLQELQACGRDIVPRLCDGAGRDTAVVEKSDHVTRRDAVARCDQHS